MWNSSSGATRHSSACCDLMLIWNVKQLPKRSETLASCCDLMLIWNVKQYLAERVDRLVVVIWCLFEMWNSLRAHAEGRRRVVIWCLFEMWNSCAAPWPSRSSVVIWCLFEMWNSPTIIKRSSNQVVIWCLFEMWNSPKPKDTDGAELWFDAYLKCETVVVSELVERFQLWFDAYLKCETVHEHTWSAERGLWFDAYLKCETVRRCGRSSTRCCDLMLIWNVKQWTSRRQVRMPVVIWCLFEMWNSQRKKEGDESTLWFDAYLKCETVSCNCPWEVAGCDLMLIWNVKQSTAPPSVRRWVVIWCLFEMWNSVTPPSARATPLWFDAYLKCETVARLREEMSRLLWFDAYLKCETVLLVFDQVKRRLWFDAYLKCETVNEGEKERKGWLWFDAYLKCETVLRR